MSFSFIVEWYAAAAVLLWSDLLNLNAQLWSGSAFKCISLDLSYKTYLIALQWKRIHRKPQQLYFEISIQFIVSYVRPQGKGILELNITGAIKVSPRAWA